MLTCNLNGYKIELTIVTKKEKIKGMKNLIYKNNLKGIRVSKGLTQESLAKLIDMPKSTYIKKENEETYFNIKEAIAL